MPLTKQLQNVAIHQQQVDEPNDIGGLTASQVKVIFDSAAVILNSFINNTLIPELESALTAKTTELTTHKTSSDHDSRYYTEAEIDTKVATLQDADTTNNNNLNNHKLSNDHDARYYTETEADSKFSLKTELQSVVLGQIPNDTLTDDKLSNAAGNIKSNFNAHLAENVSTANKTYYVDEINGNDNNNGESKPLAFKTLTKAFEMIPDKVDHTYSIIIVGNLTAAGNLKNKKISGSLTIKGDTTTAENQTLASGILVANCDGADNKIIIEYIKISAGGIAVNSSRGVLIRNCKPQPSGGYAAVNCKNSQVAVQNCDFGTVAQRCIAANWCSVVYSENNTGNGTLLGLDSEQASTIGKFGTQPTGTSANESTYAGGAIR